MAGVASAEALRALGFESVQLKWPNDLVVACNEGDGRDGGLRKLAGLLVEGGGEAAGPARAVIGLGLNVAMPADTATGIDQPWIDLATLAGGQPPSRNVVAAVLLSHWLPALSLFDEVGLAPFLEPWARFDALAGREVLVHAHDGDHAGVAVGLADDGGLRVRIGAGERVVHAGEVSVRPV